MERLWRYYYQKEDVLLTEKEEEIRKRVNNIWALQGDFLTDTKCVRAHVKWCADQGITITERHGWNDLQHSRMLFGNPQVQNKQAKKAVVSEWLLRALEYAWKEKDLQSFERLVNRYNKVNGLEESDEIAGENRAPIMINFKASPEVLKRQIEEMRKKAENTQAEDISYDEV